MPVGFELSPPASDELIAFAKVLGKVGATDDGLVKLPQVEVDGLLVDTVDRVQIGADILRRIVAAGQ